MLSTSMDKATEPYETNEFGLPGIGIPAEVLLHPELSPTEKQLFGLIQSLAHTEKGCWATNQWLGGMLNVGVQTISNGVANLKKWKFIEVSYSKRSNGNQKRTIHINPQYKVIYSDMIKGAYKKINRGVLKNLYTHIKKFIYPYKKFISNNSIYNNKDKNKDITPDPSGSGEEDQEQSTPSQSDNNGKPSAKERTKKYIPLAKYLASVVRSHINYKIDKSRIKSWARDLRLLHEKNGVHPKRQKQILKWYKKNIGGDYIPEAFSGSSFRDKFPKLEAAMKRQKNPPSNGEAKPSTGYYEEDYDFKDPELNI